MNEPGDIKDRSCRRTFQMGNSDLVTLMYSVLSCFVLLKKTVDFSEFIKSKARRGLIIDTLERD